MPGRINTYAFINAKLRTRISMLLSGEQLESIARAHSLPEAVVLLRETSYAPLEQVYGQTGDIRMCEVELYRRELTAHAEVVRYVQGTVLEVVRALAIRYEIENLKYAIRLWFDRVVRGRQVGGSTGYLNRDRVHYELSVDELVNAGSSEELARILRKTPYAKIIESSFAEVIQRESLFPFEIALDRHFFEQLFSAIRKLPRMDAEIAGRLVGVQIDLHNIGSLLRFRQYYGLSTEEALSYTLPKGASFGPKQLRESYSEEDSTSSIEKLVSDKYPALRSMLAGKENDESSRLVLMERLLEEIMLYEVHRVLGGYPFTIGIILSYFVLKQREIHKLVAILNAKLYKLADDRIVGLL